MRAWILALAGSMLAAPIVAPKAAHAATGSCADLTRLALPHAKVTAAEDMAQYPAAADVDPKGPPPIKTPFCRVKITAAPTGDSDIKIELWIPSGEGWNGRYLQVGNGGFAGKIPYYSLAAGLRKGYAVAGTDDGHEVAKDDDTSAAWAMGHPQKVIDFGWRALKETTDLSKMVLAAYATPPKYSYFNGCSDGGREALMEAQRFPKDFDGIVAGDPAFDWTHLQAAGALGQQALFKSKASFLPISKLAALQTAARKACADETGVIENPLTCHFDPKVLQCQGPETDQCLTGAQIATAKVLYDGRRDATGRLILPGLDPGAEAAEKNGWSTWVLGDVPNGGAPSLAWKFNHNFFAYMAYGHPDYDLKTFRYERDMPAIQRKLAPILNSTSPDLSAFKARGGKLIQYHGWADPAIPGRDSILYFDAVQKTMGDTAGFYRLYMAPGMLHCVGGPGPSAVDWQGAISAWVEKSAAPDRIIAAKFVDDTPSKGVALKRPICAFPKVAQWDGKGEKTKAESFVCTAA